MTLKKIIKLIFKLQDLNSELNRTRDLAVHHRIDQFYHMQKSAELKILIEQLAEIEEKKESITTRMEEVYRESFLQWKTDARWLNRFIAMEKMTKQTC